MIAVLVTLTIAVVGVLLLRARFMIVTVEGQSMAPELLPGERVLVRRCGIEPVRLGQIIVLLGPRLPGNGLSPAEFLSGVTNETRSLMIKRVAGLPGEHTLVPSDGIVVAGDNPDASYDSRQAGAFDVRDIRGVVLRKIREVAREQDLSGH